MTSAASSSVPPPNYNGVIASNSVSLTLGSTVWNVNTVASFAVNNVVQITWTGDSGDFMVGVITEVDPVALTMTINAQSVHGDSGIVWSQWSITLLALNADSSSGFFINAAQTVSGAGLSVLAIAFISLITTAVVAVM